MDGTTGHIVVVTRRQHDVCVSILVDCLRTVVSNAEDVIRWMEIPDQILLEHLKDDIDAFLRRSLVPHGTNDASVIHIVEHWLDRGIVNTEGWEPDLLCGFCVSPAWDLTSMKRDVRWRFRRHGIVGPSHVATSTPFALYFVDRVGPASMG